MSESQVCSERTILVVEDDADIRDSLADVLESEGYRVGTAANGREGLDRLQHMGRPCLILLDLMMPVMSGGEFLSVLRRSQLHASLPVVVVSAWPKDAHRLGDAAQAFVRKPVALDSLLAIVGRFCPPGRTAGGAEGAT